MKVGILGGTFYPIHNGHMMLASYALTQYNLDKIWFMPNHQPPHKNNQSIADMTRHRVEMVKRAIAPYPQYELQMYEVEKQDVSYLYKTMEYFKETYPEDEFYFIIGADSLFAFDTWVYPERIAASCVLLAAYRDDKGTDAMKDKIAQLNTRYQGDFRLLETPTVDISSTQIRDEDTDMQTMVPEAVWEYIKENHLFGRGCKE